MADPIDRLARAVSDGALVDWVKEKTTRPEHLDALEQLSVIDRIARANEEIVRGDAASIESVLDSTEAATLDEASREAPKPLFLWGRLQVLEKVGEGGGGEVYRAFDPTLKSEVALKLLRRDYADSNQLARRFLDEARSLARVRHPNVLTVYGADRSDGRVGMWTEFIRGKSLEQHVAEHGPLSACEATVIGLDLCRALAAVHAEGLVHRDVKTTNVMRAEGGRIVLMDFGSVAALPDAGAAASTAGMQGTPITMPPEQLRGTIAGPATDIYGLGVLVYRLVTKRYPVEATSLPELEAKHGRGEHVGLRDRRADLPLEFVRVVETALKPDPAERYQSAGAMEQALASTIGAIVDHRRLQRRNLGVLIGSIAIVAVAAGALIGHYWAPAPTPLRVVTPAPARPPLTAEVTLFRRAGAKEVPLAAGDRVAPGDLLSMSVRSADSMFVYVLDEDAAGEVNGLFPVKGLVPSNPLGAHVRHRLPGDLGPDIVYWNITSPGGRETITAIGSRAPIAELETALAKIPAARPGRPVRFGKLDPMDLRNLRGITGGKPMPPPEGEAAARLEEEIEGLKARGKETGNVWVWSIELRNPEP